MESRPMDAHRLAERRSLAMHARIAARLAGEPELIEHARVRVEQWALRGTAYEFYVAEWRRALALPIDQLARLLADPGEAATALRQATPFAGALGARERWRVWRAVPREAK